MVWSYPALGRRVDDCGFICTKSGQLIDVGPSDSGSPPMLPSLSDPHGSQRQDGMRE